MMCKHSQIKWYYTIEDGFLRREDLNRKSIETGHRSPCRTFLSLISHRRNWWSNRPILKRSLLYWSIETIDVKKTPPKNSRIIWKILLLNLWRMNVWNCLSILFIHSYSHKVLKERIYSARKTERERRKRTPHCFLSFGISSNRSTMLMNSKSTFFHRSWLFEQLNYAKFVSLSGINVLRTDLISPIKE